MELEWVALRHLLYQNHDLTAPVIYLYHAPGTAKNEEDKMWLCSSRIVTRFDHIIARVLHSIRPFRPFPIALSTFSALFGVWSTSLHFEHREALFHTLGNI